ncbi:sugar isomerase domain-containing protein [Salinibacterium sp. M195]|uniref:sugar isomerase domain-containing protein n=1 Tax=Salinibacterium sp. M195 TaxID=2583374 RepID=UPI001C63113E|nr:sugar isomerase domain-containing protein [Salinibacterium sp. M195]QYH34930.1 sugar isomerase domain-containing protein [Salinibacterium sp. M195]
MTFANPNALDIASPAARYLSHSIELIERLLTAEAASIEAASRLIADALIANRTIHVFGTGHSHMLAEELFYRAGGLVNVKPLLFEGLMLHSSAPLSTSLERLPGLAAALLLDHPIARGDVLIVASNSGSNAVTSELVQRVIANGVPVIALTSLNHATSPAARPTSLPRLHELATVVIDNGGSVGDAAVDIVGIDKRVSPTSTVVGAAILNAVMAEAIQLAVNDGVFPDIYESSNTSSGDATNHKFTSREATV